ncbi:MAG: hypothetical protein F2806_05870 [Actinobacteria bacterium]|nr:hypothetical protein [Actinomycetota bacterium]
MIGLDALARIERYLRCELKQIDLMVSWYLEIAFGAANVSAEAFVGI